MIKSSTRIDAKLHKRHVALSFHRVREAMASGVFTMCHLRSERNPADMLSKFWSHNKIYKFSLQPLLFWKGDTMDCYDPDPPMTAKPKDTAKVHYAVRFCLMALICTSLYLVDNLAYRRGVLGFYPSDSFGTKSGPNPCGTQIGNPTHARCNAQLCERFYKEFCSSSLVQRYVRTYNTRPKLII